MRAAICSCLALGLLAALVPLAGATPKPALELVHTRPVTVHGAHFGAYERVRVTLRKPSGQWRRRVRAGAAGTFSARFRGVGAGRCTGFSVTARGRSGARATFLRRSPVTCEGGPAAPGQKVSASPRPVHFGQTLTIRGSGWPVIEFCRRKVRLTLTTSQQGFRIGAVRTRDDGRFTFHYVPRKSKVGAGLWRLRARMRCESGKDGSTGVHAGVGALTGRNGALRSGTPGIFGVMDSPERPTAPLSPFTETPEEPRGGESAEPYKPHASAQDFQLYFHGVAQAHHVIRKVFRIIDGQASKAGVEPLEHKLLIQAMGAGEKALRVSDLASRLDIAPALASRLVKSLEGKGLVSRSLGQADRRTTVVDLTWEGRRLLGEIDRDVRLHVDYFQAQLNDEERAAAVRVFAFYLGAPPTAG